MCRNIVTTPSDLELWTREISYVSWIGLGWLICGTISLEPYKLWTWDLYHWIQQRLTFKRMCRNIVTTPSDVKLWTHEISHVSWIWFGLVDLRYHNYLLNPTSYRHETCTIGYSKDWGLKGFVVSNLLNPISSEHKICTIGCSKDWSVMVCDYTYSWSLHGFGSHPWVNLCRHHYIVNPIATTFLF